MSTQRTRWASGHAGHSRAKPEPPKLQLTHCWPSLDSARRRIGEQGDISAARATLRSVPGREELRLQTRLDQAKAPRMAGNQRGKSFRGWGREDARSNSPRATTY